MRAALLSELPWGRSAQVGEPDDPAAQAPASRIVRSAWLMLAALLTGAAILALALWRLGQGEGLSLGGSSATASLSSLTGLGLAFWSLALIALALCLSATWMVASRPGAARTCFGLLTVCQAGQLLLMAVQPPGQALAHSGSALALYAGLDLTSAAALLGACWLPLVVPEAKRWPTLCMIAVLAAASIAGLAAAVAQAALPYPWWVVHGLVLAAGVGAVVAMSRNLARGGQPSARLLHRLSLVGLAALSLLTLTLAVDARADGAPGTVGVIGTSVWRLGLAALFLGAPWINRPGLAARWVGGGAAPSAEQMFDSLYRAARDMEHAPGQANAHVQRLLRELFNPLDSTLQRRALTRSRVSADGSTLAVPLPKFPRLVGADSGDDPGDEADGTLILRGAHHGTRRFSPDDARLSDRVMDQLRHAIAFDRAVEQGRSEERTRIAQDLHDDIGARLLTLMYKAQNPEMEEYLRHTLQDLKTLTRGLAASNHRLSHAAAEWKSDLTQRLAATHCDLKWSFTTDRDMVLGVVQWSGLTRILRELVNNIIAHAHATEVEIAAQCDRGRMLLSVADDGIGRAPETWSHGLGLGGVRKRVKLLGGEVVWRERGGRGIRCEVRLAKLGERV